jgi:hypothetical protein
MLVIKMETGTKKIGLRIAAGFLVAITVILAVFASGIQLPTVKAKTGTLTVLLTDAPTDLKHLNITIDSLSALNVDESEENWIDLPLINEEGVYFDLLALYDVTMELSDAEIPAGKYTKLRMTIKTANATKDDGTIIDPLKVPPGKLDIIIHFEIMSEETTVLLIDMEADWVAISKSNRLRPVFKATIAEPPSPEESSEE